MLLQIRIPRDHDVRYSQLDVVCSVASARQFPSKVLEFASRR